MKIKLTPNLKRLIAAITLWLVVIIVAGGLDWYIFTLLRGKAARLVELKEATVKLELRRALLLKEQEHIKELEPSLSRVENIFVDASNPILFIQSLEKLARGNGVAIKLGIPEKRDRVLSMRLEAGGGLGGVLAFITEVEFLPEQVIFRNTSFEILTVKIPVQPAGSKKAPPPPVEQARAVGSIEFLAK
ncbi:MAG: hypothetical protein WAP51_01785 [Candidatus Sungiibacteriota bacterium]